MEPNQRRADHLLREIAFVLKMTERVREALEIMINCYQHLGLKDLQNNVEQVYQVNFHEASTQGKQRSWWHIW